MLAVLHFLPYTICLIDAFVSRNSQRQFLSFLIKLKQQRIPASKVNSYIKQHKANNPITGQLFDYDEENQQLHFGQLNCNPEDVYSLRHTGEY